MSDPYAHHKWLLPLRERGVRMLYDQYGVRRLEVWVSLIPPVRGERFPSGRLSSLYAALNQDEIFDHSSGQSRHAATFEGEQITYEIDVSGIHLDARAFSHIDDLKLRFEHLLDETAKVIGGRRIYLVTAIRVMALVPEDKGREVGPIIQKKVLTKLKDEHYRNLGSGQVTGAALQFAGYSEDPEFSYSLTIAPYLPQPDMLYLEAMLDEFGLDDPEDFVHQGSGSVLRDQMQAAYDFTRNNLATFAQSFLP